jgi:probable phosphoglycerate mutase
MAVELTLIRHGETTANADSVWQGHGDADLSRRGEDQVRALGKRLEGEEFDLVVASDLVRTMRTAELAGLDATPDARWREMDIGRWEGLTREQVDDRFSDELAAIRAGEDVPMGGGESWHAFAARIDGAFSQLIEDAPGDARLAVVAHGGVILAVVSALIGFRDVRPWPIERIHNTAITRVTVGEQGARLDTLNDATHTEWDLHQDSIGPLVTLVRHGESEGNVADQWHGRTDSALSERGLGQGAELAKWYGGIGRVYASPLQRARLTAEAFARSHGIDDVTIVDDLMEMDFGEWEGLTTDEIRTGHPESFERVFHHGEDLPRGTTGETIAGTARRIRGVVGEVARRHPGGGAALFTHGGVIWALAADIMEVGWEGRGRIALPTNTSVTHVRVGPDGPVLVDYNLRA